MRGDGRREELRFRLQRLDFFSLEHGRVHSQGTTSLNEAAGL